MRIVRTDARFSRPGPAAWFSGQVHLDEIATAERPSRLRAVRVTFAPGARTAWHTHPLGQTLHVVSGLGRVQLEGQAVMELWPGDTVLIGANERHWHGAAPSQQMVRLAMQEVDEANVDVVWLEQVTDAESGSGDALLG